jgi:sugar/nucleoside kinase (ribokinase family)
MPWTVTVAGTIHMDDITTPAGRRERQIGGSALYFSLAAAGMARVHLNAICGRDAETVVRDNLAGLPVDLCGLTVSDHPTFRWHAIQDFRRWVARTVAEEPGCDPEWRPRLSPEAAAAPILFLGSMSPSLQQAVLAQSHAGLIGLDSMTSFIRPQRQAVLEVVAGCDVLFLDRVEVMGLVPGASTWRAAAHRLVGMGRLRAVVVKAGPKGAALVTAAHTLELSAAAVDAVVDPTGAGDGVAGGFLGLCAREERDDVGFFREALEEGLRCAAEAISSFGTEALRARSRSMVGAA